jgi:hypothetical protein
MHLQAWFGLNLVSASARPVSHCDVRPVRQAGRALILVRTLRIACGRACVLEEEGKESVQR